MKIMLEMKKRGKHQQIVVLSSVIDYMWCPKEHEDICLYVQIRLYKAKMNTRTKKTSITKMS